MSFAGRVTTKSMPAYSWQELESIARYKRELADGTRCKYTGLPINSIWHLVDCKIHKEERDASNGGSGTTKAPERR